MSTYEQFIDPARLLVVDIESPTTAPQVVLAAVCRFVAVNSAEATRVAVEIVFDPAAPNPTQPYYCPTERLVRRLVRPDALRRVRPYRPGPG